MRFIDLFGGVGGFRLGIERATEGKWECVWYCDNDKYAVQTYNKNFNESYLPTDITKVEVESIPDFDILCAGFPCQAFSIAGKRKGFDDTRGTLFFEIARIAKVKRPKILFLENVKGLLNHDSGNTFKKILQTLDELGYDIQWEVLNSKNFGVPQNRERVFIVGHLRGEPRPKVFPLGEIGGKASKLQGLESDCTIGAITARRGNALSDGDYVVEGDGKAQEMRQIIGGSMGERVYGTNGISASIRSEGGGHGAKTGLYLISATKKGYSKAEIGDGIRLEFPQSKTARGRVIKGLSNSLKRSGTEGVLDSNMKIRRLTPLETERLQGFPDNWTEGVSDTQKYKQMGNAVTVNVIEVIARKLIGFGA